MSKILDNIPTKQWVRDRQHYIGGSEIAATLGESSYQTPLNLWLIKTGRIQPKDSSGEMVRVNNQPEYNEEYAKTVNGQD